MQACIHAGHVTKSLCSKRKQRQQQINQEQQKKTLRIGFLYTVPLYAIRAHLHNPTHTSQQHFSGRPDPLTRCLWDQLSRALVGLPSHQILKVDLSPLTETVIE